MRHYVQYQPIDRNFSVGQTLTMHDYRLLRAILEGQIDPTDPITLERLALLPEGMLDDSHEQEPDLIQLTTQALSLFSLVDEHLLYRNRDNFMPQHPDTVDDHGRHLQTITYSDESFLSRLEGQRFPFAFKTVKEGILFSTREILYSFGGEVIHARSSRVNPDEQLDSGIIHLFQTAQSVGAAQMQLARESGLYRASLYDWDGRACGVIYLVEE